METKDESDSESDSDPDFDDDPKSGGDHVSGGQASGDDHAFGGNHDSKGGSFEGGASKGILGSYDGHDSEGGTFEGDGSGQSPKVNKGGTSGGSKNSEESPKRDTVPRLEGDSEQIGIGEVLKKKVWLNAMKEELEASEENKTWKLTELPREKKTISARSIFKEKSAFLNGVLEVAHSSNQKKLV